MRLQAYLVQDCFTNPIFDASLFLKIKGESKLIVFIYVDDIIVARGSQENIDKFVTLYAIYLLVD